MSLWAAVEETRFQYEQKCHAENLANELHLAYKTAATQADYQAAMKAKATAYRAYGKALLAALHSGEKPPASGA